MPRGNHTGPFGEGPMTGRAMGYCAGNNRPGCAAGPGAGHGRGRGGRGPGFGGRGMAWGRGYGMGYPAYGSYGEAGPAEAPLSRENRKEAIQGEVEALEEQLRFLKREMEALDEEREQQ